LITIPAAVSADKTVSKLARPRVVGKYIYIGTEKFYVKGVTYGPFEPEIDGSEYHTPEMVNRDFALMATKGINSVRTYTTPPRWLLDIATKHGLRVMIGVPWEQHIAFLDQAVTVDAIEAKIRTAVRSCAGHPAVLCYSIGNEIPASIVRWHGRRPLERILERYYWAAKDEDPEALVTYVNFPPTEYLTLPFLDLVAFNVYLEHPETLRRYLARLQNIATDRPLLMAEVGLDSLRNGEQKQAAVLGWQVSVAFSEAAAGVFLFSWTDEWFRGGLEITDWKFGLVTRDRRPKAALNMVANAFLRAPVSHGADWPMVSVVVCSYNGAKTLSQTLNAIARLRYPRYEVVIVNDGSRDTTQAIAASFGARLISISNGGLSNARNLGWQNARGQIVAYIDDDASPDPHWLSFLVAGLLHSDFAGIGGPNLSPPRDGFVAQCVDHAPGNPTHVLIDDREAEHLPGCNMAFWRDRIAAIGGFDATFRIAGDDVDFCWRLQEQGWKLGFSAGAVVWHHRRDTIKTYWKQQMNYGRAEAMLERKWPAKYNGFGHVSWAGRVYAKALPVFALSARQRIYHGTWGTALFQSIYGEAPSTWRSLVAMPEWNLVVALLGIAAGVSMLSAPSLWFPLAFGMALAISLINAVWIVSCIHLRCGVSSARERFKHRALITGLHLLQPIARLWGRLTFGLTPWRRRGMMSFVPPWRRTLARWDEQWRSPEDRLHEIERRLRESGAIVARGGNFDDWDLVVRGGLLGEAHLRMAIEEHGQGKQLVRLKIWPGIFQQVVVACVLLLALVVTSTEPANSWGALALSAFAITLFSRMVYEFGMVLGAISHAFGTNAAAAHARPIIPSDPVTDDNNSGAVDDVPEDLDSEPALTAAGSNGSDEGAGAGRRVA
jgi:O-antigen biosynthesis protein